MRLPDWNLGYFLADAKIVEAEKHNTSFSLKLDCSWTSLHPSRYIDELIFEDCDILELPDIRGMFWHKEEVLAHGERFQLRLVVADEKNHKHIVKLRYSSVRACRK